MREIRIRNKKNWIPMCSNGDNLKLDKNNRVDEGNTNIRK